MHGACLTLAYLFISHDLGVVEHIGHRVAVMYLGRIVETGKEELFTRPMHPYTRASGGGPYTQSARQEERLVLEGDMPSPWSPPSGGHFHTQCPFVLKRCRTEEPKLRMPALAA